MTFGDNGKGRIIGHGSIGNNSSSLIENVLFVDGLKHNLLSISQLCDKGFKVIFESSHCIIKDSQNDKIIFICQRNENIYTIDISKYEGHNRCFSSMHDESWLWHRRLGHVNMNLITQLNKNELVRGLPKISFEKDKVCEACQMGKQIKTSFKNKIFISTSRPLELLHMDLFGPSKTTSLGGKSYAFVIVDDFSRYTWVLFLANKNDVFHEFSKLCKKIQNEKGFTISCIRSDHGREFENVEFDNFVMSKELNIHFQLLELPNKMGLLKGKIQPCKKWQEPFFMKTICQIIFGPKQSILHVIY